MIDGGLYKVLKAKWILIIVIIIIEGMTIIKNSLKEQKKNTKTKDPIWKVVDNKMYKINEITNNINVLINKTPSAKARLNKTLKYIREEIGLDPLILNHYRYKSNKLILFKYEEYLVAVKIFGSKYYYDCCSFDRIEKIKDLDIKYDKRNINIFFSNLVGWGYCTDISYDSSRYDLAYYNRYYVQGRYEYYKRYYKSYKNKFESTQKLQTFFEK